MTKNQREFQKQLARLERSISRLTKQHQFIQSAELPKQPKRVTRRHIKQLEELKGRHFVSEIDIETGEVIREASYEDIYKRKPRKRSTYQRVYDAEKARAYRETHREQIAEANKRYREKHKDEIRERQRAYRQANKETINEKARVYREKNKQRINANARRRRRQKKLETKMTIAPTAFNIFDELDARFDQGIQNIVAPYVEDKLWAMSHLKGILYSNRERIGNENYTNYLRSKEEDIAEYIDVLVHASTQENVYSCESIIAEIINASGEPLPRETLEALSNATGSGW